MSTSSPQPPDTLVSESLPSGICIISLTGRLNLATVETIEPRFITLTAAPDHRAIIVDLSELHYIGSFGLRLLLCAAKDAKTRGVTFVVAGAQREVERTLKTVGYGAIMSIVPSRTEALRRCSESE